MSNLNSKYIEHDIKAKVFFYLYIFLYLLLFILLDKHQCNALNVDNCLVEGKTGYLYLSIWVLMYIGAIYLLYVSYVSFKKKRFPSVKMPFKMKVTYGARCYVNIFSSVFVSVVLVLYPIYWEVKLNDAYNTYNEINNELRLIQEDNEKLKNKIFPNAGK